MSIENVNLYNFYIENKYIAKIVKVLRQKRGPVRPLLTL